MSGLFNHPGGAGELGSMEDEYEAEQEMIDAEDQDEAAAAAAGFDLFGEAEGANGEGHDEDGNEMWGLHTAPQRPAQQARQPQGRASRLPARGSPSGSADGSWGGHGHQATGVSTGLAALLENDQRRRDAEGASQGDGASSVGGGGGFGGGGGGGDGGGDELTYEGFNESIMRVEGEAKPFTRGREADWVELSALGPDDMRPKRAMCVNITSEFMRRDAEFFRSWQLPKGAESRAKATAAIVSLLFAGTHMGIPSGKHEEKMRGMGVPQADGGKAKEEQLKHVERYMYIPANDERDTQPMFQIGIEEIYNTAEDGELGEVEGPTQVVALRVWLFIYDEWHSTSALMRQVMKNTRALHDSQRVGAESAMGRNKSMAAEASRNAKSGFSFADLDSDFEGTVGGQYMRVRNVEDWQQMLALHSGKTSRRPGRPVMSDLAGHLNCAAGRRQFDGDYRTGCGGRHPAAPELLLNAKREESLAFGLADVTGEPLNVCEEQLSVRSYWLDDGCFRVPNIGRSSFWLCTSFQKKTIFDLPLTRPLQGTVVAGKWLMQLFLEHERRLQNIAEGNPDAEIDYESLPVGQIAYNRFRSLAMRKDAFQSQQDSLLRNTLHAFDLMNTSGGAAAAHAGGSVSFNANASGDEANYVLRTTAITDVVRTETDRVYAEVVQPWQTRVEHALDAIAQPLRAARVSEDDDRWNPYFEKRSKFQKRFYEVKKELTEYHLRLVKSCFLSKKDAATLPPGYCAMYKALDEGIAKNGGTGSIAFGTLGGRQMMCKDRMVWGELQEWLRGIFVDDCKIDGRDRRIMVSLSPSSGSPHYTRVPYPRFLAHNLQRFVSGRALPYSI